MGSNRLVNPYPVYLFLFREYLFAFHIKMEENPKRLAMTVFFVSLGHSYAQMLGDVLLDRGNVADQVLYLSDIPYMKAQVGWGNVSLDKTQSNTSLILVLNGYSTVFNLRLLYRF